MTNQLMTFEYEDKKIEFQFRDKGKLMVNASQMAEAFDKRLDHFMESGSVKIFKETLIRPPYGGLIGVFSEKDIVDNRKRNGLWVHRLLAIKLAAWLNPVFEVWIYMTIDKILTGDYTEVLEFKNTMTELIAEKKENDRLYDANYKKLKDNKYFIAHNSLIKQRKNIADKISDLNLQTLQSIYKNDLFTSTLDN